MKNRIVVGISIGIALLVIAGCAEGGAPAMPRPSPSPSTPAVAAGVRASIVAGAGSAASPGFRARVRIGAR
jgi:hypothetical protein